MRFNLVETEVDLIDEVVRVYGPLSGSQMSALTHKEATPWSKIWNNGVGIGDRIPNDLILEEFRSLRNGAKAK